MIQNSIFKRAVGWGVMLSVVGMAGAVTMPNLYRIQDTKASIAQQNELIARHLDVLARPHMITPHTNLQKYILPAEGSDLSTLSADFQAELLAALASNQARLINLSQADNVVDIQGLEGLDFRLAFEGDLEAVTGFADALSKMRWPVLVERFELVAQGPETRPDRKLRATLALRIWSEASV
ncbi:MAG: hypothetical protein AAFY34_16395 [Pseudomonadota bacterium]